jgi:hypothetical protein
MSSAKANVLRRIAEGELVACFRDLAPVTKNELATSIVRQWITYEGAAVILTRDQQFWFRASRLDDGNTQVVRDVQQNTFVEHMRRSRVMEEEIPGLLHALSLRQSVRCSTDYGEVLQLRVNPANKMFHIELVPDQER